LTFIFGVMKIIVMYSHCMYLFILFICICRNSSFSVL